MKILAIDTSCDETAAAVTDGTKVLSNVIWSQASAHAKFGGVMPSLAQRLHEERIDWTIERAISKSQIPINKLDAIAVTIGPGLSIALAVGVNKAKELAKKYNKPLIPINHVEAHLLSPFANLKFEIRNSKFPMYGLVVSGGNTLFVLIKNIGDYEVLAQTVDDALGEALDKAARMLGLGYPGGAVLEKMARLHKVSARQALFKLPIPLVGQEKRMVFSYSGLKTAMVRKIEGLKSKNKNLSKQDVYDLSASFQDVAFKHIIRVMEFGICNLEFPKVENLLLGGGVAINTELKKRLRSLGAKFGVRVHIPYTKKLYGDNAAMIGVCAYLKITEQKLKLSDFYNYDSFDRNPKLKI